MALDPGRAGEIIRRLKPAWFQMGSATIQARPAASGRAPAGSNVRRHVR